MARKLGHALVAASLVMSLVPGCALTGLLPGQPGGTGQTASTSKIPEFKTKLANLTFMDMAESTKEQLNKVAPTLMGNTGAANGTREGITAPSSAGMAGDSIARTDGGTAGGSGSYTGGVAQGSPASSVAPMMYNYGYYFGGGLGPMKLDKAVEASAAGSSGGWNQVREQVINPVLADWAPDANLISGNATLDENGDPILTQSSYFGETGWHMGFSAPSIHEVMYFLVTPAETKIIRMRWIPITIDTTAMAVDAKGAIERAKAGIRTSGFKSLEDIKGIGFFYPKSEGYGNAVPMADVAMSAPSRGGAVSGGGSSSGSAPTVYYQENRVEEEVLELQPGGRWNANVSVIGDYTVWQLYYNNYYGSPEVMKGMPTPAIAPVPPTDASQTKPDETSDYKPQPYSYTDNYVYAIVDARSGDVLSLRRPRKVSVTYTETTYNPYQGDAGTTTAKPQ